MFSDIQKKKKYNFHSVPFINLYLLYIKQAIKLKYGDNDCSSIINYESDVAKIICN
jgi:hypothetical protein